MKIKNFLIKLLKWIFFSIFLLFILIFGYFEYEEIPIYNLKVAYKFILGETNYKPYDNLIEKLGYSKNDRLLILHADDIGLSKSVNKASFNALQKRYISSGSVMMTCEYISEVGQFAIQNPEIDLGLHLTVTSEWKNYKWDGVLDPSETPSLINKKGELFNNKKKFVLNADPEDLRKELQAQIDLSRSIGINPTHIDSHEGALFFDQDLFKVYLELGKENKLPVFIPKLVAVHFDENFPKPKNTIVIENFYMAEPDIEFNDWESYYLNILNELKPGLSQLIIHLAYDNDEMKSITVDHPNYGSKWRNLDYDIVSSDKFQKALIRNNIKLITWKEIQNVVY